MTKKHHILLYGALGLALLVALITAYDRYTAAEQSRLYLEDSYTQRRLEAQENLQSMALKLGKAPVVSDMRSYVEILSGVSRQAASAADALSALPVSHASMGHTVKFLNQLSDYALMLSLQAASGKAPDAQAIRTLGELKSRCILLSGDLATSEAEQWSRENLFYAPAQDADNGMDYPSMIYDGAFSDARHRGTPKALGKQQITQEEAIRLAREFVGADRVVSAEAGASTGGAIECFGVTLTLVDGTVLNADVTRQGGKMLWIMPEKANFEPRLTLEECRESALRFLHSRGYGEMEANHYQVYDGLAVINFVPVQDGVLLYPDLVKVQVRMDTGEMVGLESNNYLMNHEKRPAFAPKMSEAQARAQVSPRLTVSSMRLCVIPYRDRERLCWEAAGWYNDTEYRVYLDADTGEEAEVLQMVDSDSGRMAA